MMSKNGGEVDFERDFIETLGARDSAAPTRMRGVMLWFNGAKDLGALRTDDGERIDVPGNAFLPGEKPSGRCVGKAVEFESAHGAISGLAFLPELSPRRARRRHRH